MHCVQDGSHRCYLKIPIQILGLGLDTVSAESDDQQLLEYQEALLLHLVSEFLPAKEDKVCKYLSVISL